MGRARVRELGTGRGFAVAWTACFGVFTAMLLAVSLLVMPGVASGSHLGGSSQSDTPERGLDRVNALRAEVGLGPVGLDADLSRDAEEAARYMAKNDTLTHFPSPSKPYYTERAAASAKSSILALGPQSWEDAIDGFAVTPFHRFPLLDPARETIGLGNYEDAWVVDTKRGDSDNGSAQLPMLYPGPGDTAPAASWNGSESPDPLATCGESRSSANPVGPSITAQFERTPKLSSASLRVANGRSIAVCARDTHSYTGRSGSETDMGRLFLKVYNAIYMIPLEPLVPGEWYEAAIETDQGDHTWTFRAPFADENGGSAFEFDIEWMGEGNVSAGTSAGCEAGFDSASYSAFSTPGASAYCWQDGLTREQMATFLVKALQIPAAKRDHFSDDNGRTHEAAVNALAESGIARGCSAKKFCPAERLTRAQMATFLATSLDLPSTNKDFFTDDKGHTHEASINRLAAAKITGGCRTGRFCPQATLTRGQMAAFLHRALS